MVLINFMAILIILWHSRNEMATLHLAKTYCAPAVMYGCETLYLERMITIV